MSADIQTSLSHLLEIMRRLRDPESGCAWDAEQSFASIAPYTIEEAYEVADAINRSDLVDLQDELGDLLFQVVFHSQMAQEIDAFTFNDVLQGVTQKMIRRHPHVFGNKMFESTEELKAEWEAIKATERQERNRQKQHELQENTRISALDGVAANLPSLKRADKIQKRAARVGFDWPEITPVWDKLDEETAELRNALESRDSQAIEDEFGDMLFTLVNLGRHLGIDSESALSGATAKFEKRFRVVEELAELNVSPLDSLDAAELDALWNKAKSQR